MSLHSPSPVLEGLLPRGSGQGHQIPDLLRCHLLRRHLKIPEEYKVYE